MKLYIHMGLNRTGTHNIRFNLWEKHPQINYLGKRQRGPGRKHLEVTELISTLNNDDFDKRFNEILKKAEELKLVSEKTNLISDEDIWVQAFHYSDNNDNYRTLSRFVSRTNLLFKKINVDVYFFYVIRNQADLITSFYSRIASELGGSATFNGEELIQFFKNDDSNQSTIKRFLSGFKYFELHKNLSDAVGEDKIKFFLYENIWDNNGLCNLSNYLKIDSNISIKLLKDRGVNSFSSVFKESLRYNSPISIIFYKLKKNIKNPTIFFENFFKKTLRMFRLMFASLSKVNPQQEKDRQKMMNDFYNQYNIIKNNKSLIKRYYKDDCLALKKSHKLDIEKYNYF
jgi:hypothetical protein